MVSTRSIHVAVGVIRNQKNQILISQRAKHVHQGGLWEFPGGKVEPDENVEQALARELKEELNISVGSQRPLIKVHHQYEEYAVFLDVYEVAEWTSPQKINNDDVGSEGQSIKWVDMNRLDDYEFPEANLAIIKATKLPDTCLICPEPEYVNIKKDDEAYIRKFESCISKGINLCQLRFGDDSKYYEHRSLVKKLIKYCKARDIILLINSSEDLCNEFKAEGLHLNSQRLMSASKRPSNKIKWVAASCHSELEIAHASKLGLDFALLSPVNKTNSHVDAEILGWEKFNQLVENVSIPVYALGGMEGERDIELARDTGGQGIAVLSSVWGLDSRSRI